MRKLFKSSWLIGLAALCALGGRVAVAEPAMWVVKQGDSTVYLLGTVHLLKSGTNWHTDKLDAAFRASSEYWMETDVEQDPAVAQDFAAKFGMDTQHRLAEKLAPQDYATFVKSVAAFGARENQVAEIRPWFANLLLTDIGSRGSSGYDSTYGVDRALETAAKKAGKPVKTFETLTEQLGFFADLPEKVELAALTDTLHTVEGGKDLAKANLAQVDAMSAAWLAGDTRRFYDASFKDVQAKSPEVFDALIVERNAAWVSKIAGLLQKPGTYFVAVGAAHLVGPDGLPALLQADGYKVERF